MPHEKHPKQIIYFSLIPIRSIVKPRDARYRRGFVGISLHSDPRVVPDAKEVVDDFKALASRRIVYPCDVRYHGEFCSGVVFEKRDDWNNTGRRDIDCELIFPHRKLLDIFRMAGEKILTIGMETGGFFCVLVRRVHNRRMEFSTS